MPETDYSLASEFQVRALWMQIDRLEHLDEVKTVAKQLVQLNAQMKQTFNELVKQGWLDDDITHRI